jgi:U3 small nucleolar RNA-associated protein 25
MARGKFKRSKGNKKNKHTNTKRYHHKRNNSKLFQKRDASHLKKYGDSHSSQDAEGTSFKRSKVSEEIRITEMNMCDDASEKEQNLFKQLLKTFTGDHLENQKKSIESDTSSEEDEPDDKTELGVAEMTKHEQEGSFEEGNSDSESESSEGDREEIDDLDPFVRHFHYDLEENLLEAVSTIPQSVDKHQQHWPVLGRFTAHLPRTTNRTTMSVPKVTIEDKRQFAKEGTVPHRITGVSWAKLHVKTQIQNNISKANYTNLREIQEESTSSLTNFQKELFSIINSYQDLYYPERTLKNGEEIRFIYCLHSVNHILKTRTRILHHNHKLLNKEQVPEEYRDQGLVRPKVVIIVPFREAALRYVKCSQSVNICIERVAFV